MSEPNPNNPETPAAAAGATGTAAAPAAAKPAAPAAAKPTAKKPERRNVIIAVLVSPFALAWLLFSASMAFMSFGTLRFLFPNVLQEPPSKFKVGFPDNFEEGKVVERFKDQNSWIVRYEGRLYALSTTCTHLGCTPNWLEREQKFKCPCHGSGFYITGINFEGPAPRPLERWAIGVGEDGQVVVDKSKKFQQERGEWTSPESFIKV